MGLFAEVLHYSFNTSTYNEMFRGNKKNECLVNYQSIYWFHAFLQMLVKYESNEDRNR